MGVNSWITLLQNYRFDVIHIRPQVIHNHILQLYWYWSPFPHPC